MSDADTKKQKSKNTGVAFSVLFLGVIFVMAVTGYDNATCKANKGSCSCQRGEGDA